MSGGGITNHVVPNSSAASSNGQQTPFYGQVGVGGGQQQVNNQQYQPQYQQQYQPQQQFGFGGQMGYGQQYGGYGNYGGYNPQGGGIMGLLGSLFGGGYGGGYGGYGMNQGYGGFGQQMGGYGMNPYAQQPMRGNPTGGKPAPGFGPGVNNFGSTFETTPEQLGQSNPLQTAEYRPNIMPGSTEQTPYAGQYTPVGSGRPAGLNSLVSGSSNSLNTAPNPQETGVVQMPILG